MIMIIIIIDKYFNSSHKTWQFFQKVLSTAV